MNSTERKRLARLEKRCDWLEARITRGTAKKRDMSFDIAELSALRWAIERIQATPDEVCEKNRREPSS